MNDVRVSTAVFPVAGLGTRFLPVTKAGPKEMLALVDKPLIHYVVEEAVQAGVSHLIFVTSSSKRAIEDYFDTNYELESRLKKCHKLDMLQRVRDIIPNKISFSYVRQSEPLGLGNAVLCAKPVVGNQPFAVLLADDIIDSRQGSCLKQMVQYFERTRSSVLGLEEIPWAHTDQYGIVQLDSSSSQIANIVEKPIQSEAPSNIAVIGRYILTPKIFEFLETTLPGKDGEIQLTDAIAMLLKEEPVYGHLIQGKRYDCGSKLGMLKATVAYALKRPDLKQPLLQYLSRIVESELTMI